MIASSASGGPHPLRSLRGAPWAGLSAIVLLFALDSFFFGGCGPHDILAPALKSGSIPVRQRLLAATQREAERPRIVTMGTSQMKYAFRAETAEHLAPELEFIVGAGAAINPLAARSLVDPVLAMKPNLVILGLSAIDTHGPIRLLQNGDAPAASPAALWRVVSIAGPGLAVRERNLLFKLLAADTIGAIRYYAAVQALGPRRWRSYDLGLERPPVVQQFARIQIGAQPTELSHATRMLVRETFPPAGRFAMRGMLQVNDLTDGPHVEIQTALLRDTIRAYGRAGVPVVVVEVPIHPIGEVAHDLRNRGKFRRIMERLAAEGTFEFVPLPEPSTWRADEFLDVVHLNDAGAERFTALLIELSRRVLRDADGA